MAAGAAALTARGGDDRRAVVVLALLVFVGALLRLTLLLAWRPAFFWFGDSRVYVASARDGLFEDPVHPAGYPLYLRALHSIAPHLTLAIVVQHALGIATAVLLYVTVRRIGGLAWVALVPAAFVLLSGSEIFLEHTLLSESLFLFLQTLAFYAAVRSLGDRERLWATCAGLVAGTAATVRWAGLFAIPVIVLWLLGAPHRPAGQRVLNALLAVVAVVVVLGGYAMAQNEATGFFGLSPASGWALYPRVATFADCSRFTPPPGTAALCEKRPPSERPTEAYYAFGPRPSPAGRLFHGPGRLRRGNARVGAFVRAAILHQPLDYLRTIPPQIGCYLLGDSPIETGCHTIATFERTALDTRRVTSVRRSTRRYYRDFNAPATRGAFSALRQYERITRMYGPLLVLILIVGGLGAIAASGRVRWAGSLLLVAPLFSIFTTAMIGLYDGRYGLPTFSPVTCAAALGGWALWTRFARSRSGLPSTASEGKGHRT